MAWLSMLLKGKKVAGRALRSSGTGAIRSVKPGVGGLKESSKMKDDLVKSVDTGVKKFGREHTNKVLSQQKGKKSLGSIVKESGEVERKRKKWGLEKKVKSVTDKIKERSGKKHGGHVNTSRENRLEELGRVDAEKAWTKKGKRNLKDEKKRIVKELN